MRSLLMSMMVFLLTAPAFGMFYTPAYASAFDAEEYRTGYIRHQTRLDLGYQIIWRKLVTAIPSATIWVIYSIGEGTLRPAWYPASTSDRGTQDIRGTWAGDNVVYYSLEQDVHFQEWDVRPAGAGADRIVVQYVAATSGGLLEVIRVRDGSAMIIGTVNTAATGNSDTRATRTLILAEPLRPNDTIRFKRQDGGGVARLSGFYVYDSDGTPAAGEQQIAMPDPTTPVHATNSSVEFAYAMAPRDHTPNFVGGYSHQGCWGYPTEVPVADESWTLDTGSGPRPWTPTPGWVSGTLKSTRTANVWYAPDHPSIASVACTYALSSNSLRVDHRFTASEPLVMTSKYCAMMASLTGCAAAETLPSGTIIDLTFDNGRDDRPATFLTDKRIRIFHVSGQVGVLDLLWCSHPISGILVWQPPAYNKAYFCIDAGYEVSTGDSWGAGWQWSVEAGKCTHPLLGDLNGDNYVNVGDLQILVTNWGKWAD